MFIYIVCGVSVNIEETCLNLNLKYYKYVALNIQIWMSINLRW